MIDMRQRHTTVGHIFGAIFGCVRLDLEGGSNSPKYALGPNGYAIHKKVGEQGKERRQESRARRKGEQKKVGEGKGKSIQTEQSCLRCILPSPRNAPDE